jgi:hypothetical protein
MSTALAVIESITAVDFFKPGASASIIDSLKAEVRAVASGLDVSKPKDRETMRSLAAKLAKTKMRLDAAGKELVAPDKERIKRIDAERGIVWDEVEGLQKEVRQPLTDWENAEKGRLAAHEERISELEVAAANGPMNAQFLSIEAMQDRIAEIEADTRDWQEFKSRGELSKRNAIAAIKIAIAAREKYDAEQAELARLRAETAEREQRERDERIAKEAREAAEARAAQERQRIEQEKFQAEARAKQAEAERVASEERAAQAAKDAEERAEREKRAAALRAESAKEAAIVAERERAEQAAKAEREAAEARERNKKHSASINRAVRDALMANCTLLSSDLFTEKVAEELVAAIAKGLIPHTKISY